MCEVIKFPKRPTNTKPTTFKISRPKPVAIVTLEQLWDDAMPEEQMVQINFEIPAIVARRMILAMEDAR